MYDDIARHLGECDAKLHGLRTQLGPTKVDLGKTPRAVSKTLAEFDVRQILANWAGVELTRINGLGLAAVLKILSEAGPDLSRFANAKHFCSWLGLCPGTQISGGKVPVGQNQAFGQPGASGAEVGGNESVAQRLRAGRVQPPVVGPTGQAVCQHRHRYRHRHRLRHRAQARAHGLLQADLG